MKKYAIILLALLALSVVACTEQEVYRQPVGMPANDGKATGSDPTVVTNEQTAEIDTSGSTTGVTGSAVKELKIEMFNFGFKTNDVIIKKGDTVKLSVVNTEGIHGLSIPTFGIDVKPGEGQSETIEFVADKAGTFAYRCNIPCGSGHMSMKGQLVVEE